MSFGHPCENKWLLKWCMFFADTVLQAVHIYLEIVETRKELTFRPWYYRKIWLMDGTRNLVKRKISNFPDYVGTRKYIPGPWYFRKIWLMDGKLNISRKKVSIYIQTIIISNTYGKLIKNTIILRTRSNTEFVLTSGALYYLNDVCCMPSNWSISLPPKCNKTSKSSLLQAYKCSIASMNAWTGSKNAM